MFTRSGETRLFIGRLWRLARREVGNVGKALKESGSIHQMDCRNPGEVFVAEITNWRVQKISLHTQQKTSSLN